MSPSTDEKPGWLEVSIEAHPDTHEALGNFLFDLGCRGMVTDDLGSPLLKAYWPRNKEPGLLKKRIHAFYRELAEIFPEARTCRVRVQDLPEGDWNHSWRRFFQSQRISPRLTILPAWEEVPENPGGHIIHIDPGPAFGTGQHPTTRMCLRAMERFTPDHPWSMLDVGTGSGILAVYGALLKAERILVLDMDPEALRWAEKNISLNGVSRSIELSPLPLSEIREPFHLITANILLDTLLELLPYFPRVQEPRGILILSGILEEQVSRMEEALYRFGYRKEEIFLEEEWACLVACRP